MNKVKVLFLAANPVDTRRLRLDVEIREITGKIRAADGRDLIEIISCWAVRPDDLLQSLNEHRPHIVHFSGHGSKHEGIILEDSQGKAKPVSSKALKSLFHTLSDNVRVILLNACFSQEQTEALTETIDCAIGTSKAIGDTAAIIFAASFYRAIAFGRSVQESFDQGKTALLLEDIPDEAVLKLILRDGVDPSNIILVNDHANPARPLDIGRDSMSTDRFYKNV